MAKKGASDLIKIKNNDGRLCITCPKCRVDVQKPSIITSCVFRFTCKKCGLSVHTCFSCKYFDDQQNIYANILYVKEYCVILMLIPQPVKYRIQFDSPKSFFRYKKWDNDKYDDRCNIIIPCSRCGHKP